MCAVDMKQSKMERLKELVVGIIARLRRAKPAPEMNEETLDACFDQVRSQVPPGIEVKISSLRKNP